VFAVELQKFGVELCTLNPLLNFRRFTRSDKIDRIPFTKSTQLFIAYKRSQLLRGFDVKGSSGLLAASVAINKRTSL